MVEGMTYHGEIVIHGSGALLGRYVAALVIQTLLRDKVRILNTVRWSKEQSPILNHNDFVVLHSSYVMTITVRDSA